jgi:hypothetical protein
MALAKQPLVAHGVGAVTLRASPPGARRALRGGARHLDTLYCAMDDGAMDVRLPKHAKKELEAYLDCGLLCRLLGALTRLFVGVNVWVNAPLSAR